MPAETHRHYFVVRAGMQSNKRPEKHPNATTSVESTDWSSLQEKFYPTFESGGDATSGNVTIEVEYSSLNYKDALCATGHPGVAGSLPMIPGIDAAGVVVESEDPQYETGQRVMVFHADFGTRKSGGYSRKIRVPGEWVYPLPDGIDTREAMIYGTAGFTAAQSVDRILTAGIPRDDGEVLVTGASGGVGTMSCAMLGSLGYRVVAVTGKSDRHAWLESIGASRCLGRDEIGVGKARPLLKSAWAAVIDTVGGETLAAVLKSTAIGATVTACGMVGGVELPTSVYPFILRGVTLAGIDSANISREERIRVWNLIADRFRIEDLDRIAVDIGLSGLPEKIDEILASRVAGRVVINLQE